MHLSAFINWWIGWKLKCWKEDYNQLFNWIDEKCFLNKFNNSFALGTKYEYLLQKLKIQKPSAYIHKIIY